jgi:hypothetical protein
MTPRSRQNSSAVRIAGALWERLDIAPKKLFEFSTLIHSLGLHDLFYPGLRKSVQPGRIVNEDALRFGR